MDIRGEGVRIHVRLVFGPDDRILIVPLKERRRVFTGVEKWRIASGGVRKEYPLFFYIAVLRPGIFPVGRINEGSDAFVDCHVLGWQETIVLPVGEKVVQASGKKTDRDTRSLLTESDVTAFRQVQADRPGKGDKRRLPAPFLRFFHSS